MWLLATFSNAVKRASSIQAKGNDLYQLKCGLAVILLALGASTASGEPRQPPPENRTKVNQILSSAQTKGEISDFVGVGAFPCIPSSKGMTLCEWRLSNRAEGWRPIAEVIATSRRVVLLCESPEDGSPRASDSCSATPQRTNRWMFSVKKKGAGRAGPESKRRAIRKKYSSVAQSWLDEARTLTEMSRLLGAIPHSCDPLATGSQTCIWRTNSSVYGHGTVAASIRANLRKKVRLICILPTNGSARAEGSCRAVIGD